VKVTFILKSLSDVFYKGNGDSIQGLDNMGALDQFRYLSKAANGDLRHCVKQRIGNGSFRDQVDLSSMLRGPVDITCNRSPRRGYVLATFEVAPPKVR
jgi:hypothetical protein